MSFAQRLEDAMKARETLFASLPVEVKEALCAADALVEILQKRFPPTSIDDLLNQAYGDLSFLLDRIKGIPND